MESSFLFLFLTLACILLEGFFSMFEMACVSFNKVRLYYYVSKNSRRAIWLQTLLQRPSALFGTTLIMITLSLQLGSEAARRLYESLGLPPEWSPLSQIFVVLLFGELSPLFAARRSPEPVALWGVPVVYFFSRLLTPFIHLIDRLYSVVTRKLRKADGEAHLFLSREEIQKAFEEKKGGIEAEAFSSTIVGNIFSLKEKKVQQLMEPLSSILSFSSDVSVGEVCLVLKKNYSPYVLLFHPQPENVVFVLASRDLLRAQEQERASTYGMKPWFIPEYSPSVQILDAFKKRNQSLAIVVNSLGNAMGFLTLELLIDQIFGEEGEEESDLLFQKIAIERTLPGEMSLEDFNRQFHCQLSYGNATTLSQLITTLLGHPPSKGEVIHFDRFEFTVEEESYLGARLLSVKSL